ncbi:MAG: hypothetical protein DDT31_01538 [Syntrophomonadaceae bacterium]|nr:hypothetical protein [Bacillota bacterium]
MRDFLADIEYYKDLVCDNKNMELYALTSKSSFVECTEKSYNIHYTDVIGMSSRKFLDGYVEFRSTDGIGHDEAKKIIQGNHYCTHLPASSMVIYGNTSLPSHTNDMPLFIEKSYEEYEVIWYKTREQLAQQGIQLLRLYIQHQQDFYYIINSSGVQGFGVRSLYAPGIEIKSCNSCFYHISPHEHDLPIEILTQKIGRRHFDNDKRCGDANVDYILFASSAASKLIYFLSFFLCVDMVQSGQSFMQGSDIQSKIFSNSLTLEENSDLNCIILGTVDGEGTERKATPIIQNGVVQRLISGKQINQSIQSTGSAYRFNHRMPPRVQPSKLTAIGDMTFEKIISEYSKIAILHDLVGIEESINPVDTNFSAYAEADIYSTGQRIGVRRIEIKSSLVTILNHIVQITSEGNYGADGSVYTGSFLIENTGLLK